MILTKSQRSHLLALIDAPFTETHNGSRTWVRSRKGISSRVLWKLTASGLAACEQVSEPTRFQRFTITDAGRKAVCL